MSPPGSAGDHEAEEDISPLEKLLRVMDAARPRYAQVLRPLYPMGEVDAEQAEAFEAGVEDWWLVVPPGPDGDPDVWHFHDG